MNHPVVSINGVEKTCRHGENIKDFRNVYGQNAFFVDTGSGDEIFADSYVFERNHCYEARHGPAVSTGYHTSVSISILYNGNSAEQLTKGTYALVMKAISDAKNKTDIPSRTPSQRHDARAVIPVLMMNGSIFGIPQIPQYVPYAFPELEETVLDEISEAAKKPSRRNQPRAEGETSPFPPNPATVQDHASFHFPRFEQHLRENGIVLTSTYVDTHKSPYPNKAKPDNSHLALDRGHGINAVKILGALKKRRAAASFTPAEKESVIAFAIEWLQQEPYRPHMLVYLTDLYFIQFFKIPNRSSIMLTSEYSFGDYSESNVLQLNDQGQHILASLLAADDSVTGFPGGRSSVVFEIPGETEWKSSALKICSSTTDVEEEFVNICYLWNAIEKLPHDKKDKFSYVIKNLVPPKGSYSMSDDRFALKMDWCGRSPYWSPHQFANIVKYLELLHTCGFVHRDISPNNLVAVNGNLVVIDYCSLTKRDISSVFHGTAYYASMNVLQQLENSVFVYHPSDDLVSLVRTCYYFLVNDQSLFIHDLVATEQNPQKLIRFWSDRLGLKETSMITLISKLAIGGVSTTPSMWQVMEDHAVNEDYEALIKDFEEYLRL
eukprot:gene15265-17063_t